MAKVLAAASIGGHWVQLLRIAKGLDENDDIAFASTNPKCANMVEGHRFYLMPDFSRWDAYKMIPAFFKSLKIIHKERPSTVITTGAAPGLILLFAAKLCGKKTIWIDSIANVAHVSASGRIARKFASRIYTQWPELSNNGIVFSGNVLNIK